MTIAGTGGGGGTSGGVLDEEDEEPLIQGVDRMEKPGEDSRDAGGVPWGLCARAVPAPGGAGGLWAQAGPATDLRLLEGGVRGPCARAAPTPDRLVRDDDAEEEGIRLNCKTKIKSTEKHNKTNKPSLDPDGSAPPVTPSLS